jgi:hypothetical protein
VSNIIRLLYFNLDYVCPRRAGAVAYFLQGISVNLPLLFASKIPSLLQHCMIGAQAGVTILALPNIRALAMGRLSLRYAQTSTAFFFFLDPTSPAL